MARSTVAVRFTGNVADLQRSIGQVNGSLMSVGKVAAAGFAVVGAAAIGAGVGLFKLGESFDEQADKIRVGTGATGEALKGLEGSFKNVLKGVPASFDDAGTAIADLNTRLGQTGPQLEETAKRFINLSRITKTDLATNVDNITRVFGDWEVATDLQQLAMDNLYRASQASGIGIDELSQSVVQFGAPLRNLGFGLDESLALLAQFNKTGVNTETVFAGLKAGVGKLAKAGEDVPTTFKRIVKEITALGPGTEATGLAIKLFGQRAGPDLADAITGGKFELEAMYEAVTQGADTINGAAKDTESFGEKWTMLKNRVLVGLEPLARQVFDGVGKAMDDLGPKVEQLVAWFETNLLPAFAQVQAWVEEHWPQIQAVITTAIDTVRSVIEGFVTVVTTLWENFGNNILEFVERVWPNIQQVIDGALQIIRGIVQTVTSLIKGDWSGVWDGIKSIVTGVWAAIQGIIKTALEVIRSAVGIALEVIGSVFKGAWDGIVDFFSKVPGRISSIASGMFDGIKDAFKSAINWIIRAWNGLEFKIPGFDPPGPGPKFGGFTLGVPNIPELHTGGTFRAPGGAREGLALLRDGERVSTPESPTGGFPDPDAWGRMAARSMARELLVLQRAG